MKATKLSILTFPGLTLDTLGLYFAALGLLRLLSRKWPAGSGLLAQRRICSRWIACD
jgi:hypothetical protein